MTNTAEQVESTVREAMASGQDVYNQVKTITLKALTERHLDRDNIAEVVHAVGKGIGEAVQSQSDISKEALQQSAKALDDALLSTAEASKLAVEEAAGKIRDFSESDLKRAIEDMNGLEGMFLDALKELTRNSSDAVVDTVNDLIGHAQKNGTAVGRQVEVLVDSMTNISIAGKDNLLSSARETAANLAKIGSGILAGIAESLNSDKP